LHLAPYRRAHFTRKDSPRARPAFGLGVIRHEPDNSFLNCALPASAEFIVTVTTAGHIDLAPGATSSDLAVMDVRNQVATDGETIVRAGIAGGRPVRESSANWCAVPTASIRSEPFDDPNCLLDLELPISSARNTLARTTSRMDEGEDDSRSQQRR
jgi:hypothetical protein